MSLNCTKAFPDYDNHDAFKKVLKSLKPHGMDDGSWRNDSCPSIGREVKDGKFVQIYIDYKSPSLSEYPEQRASGEMKMFSVQYDSESVLETDDIDLAIAKAIKLGSA